MAERLVLCGGSSAPGSRAENMLRLDLTGPGRNVELRLHDISKRMLTNLPDLVIDLLELAAYVYSADWATSRGGEVSRGMGAEWRRRFRFVIPVRRPELWSSPPVLDALSETLGFLTDDEYQFEFEEHRGSPPGVQDYLELEDEADGSVRTGRGCPVLGRPGFSGWGGRRGPWPGQEGSARQSSFGGQSSRAAKTARCQAEGNRAGQAFALSGAAQEAGKPDEGVHAALSIFRVRIARDGHRPHAGQAQGPDVRERHRQPEPSHRATAGRSAIEPHHPSESFGVLRPAVRDALRGANLRRQSVLVEDQGGGREGHRRLRLLPPDRVHDQLQPRRIR